ncbi:UNVERIFIED_CONTAM: hypothetical protein GTU68_012923 [Idotea baltica]|nr:hypothetical protein [Idotea baltica]
MGVEACLAIEADSELELVGKGKRGDDLANALKESKAEVAVDLTTAEVGFECAKIIIASGVIPVIGTSGFTDSEVSELQKLAKAKDIGGLVVPNFAVGVVLMMKFAAEAAKYMSRVEILEAHHDKKADSPSGTAVRTAELIAASMNKQLESLPDKQIIPGARGADIAGIKIHSMRLPGVVAQQEVRFGDEAQTLTLAHSSIHRSSFMPGVCLACKKAPELRELLNGLEHVL